MGYKIHWKASALADLGKINSSIALPLKGKIESYLIKAPLELGKPLTEKYKGLYRYRYGDCRIIYEILKQHYQVIIIKIGHRSGIYD